MRRVKRRIFSGSICEQMVYNIGDRVRDVGAAQPRRPRFASEEERAAHREGISRRRHIRTFNATFSPASLYSTLTFSDEEEVHTFAEARRLRDNFVRRLRYVCPESRLRLYMGRGRHTSRIHMHMVSDGIPEEIIRSRWIYGRVERVEHLREHNWQDGQDLGQDYTGLANYLFDHWTPEQGGHHWKQAGRFNQPEEEPAREIVREYSIERPPAAPKGYRFLEASATRYGYLYFKYVKIVEPARRPGRRC